MSGERGRKAITVIAGAARSGKTARVAALFVAAAREGREALVIVPDAAAARAMRRRLLGEMTALSTDAVTTFTGLAERVLAAGGVAAREIGPEDREFLLRRIVSDLAGEGRLKHFAGAAGFDGFYGQLASFIRELKACQIEPERFRAAPFEKSAREEELGEIYSRYQRVLEDERLYDSEGRFWEARVVLETAAGAGCRYDDVFIDGFSDFTANERTLVRSLAPHTKSLYITLPYESNRRADLFAKTFDTLGRLRGDFAVHVEELAGSKGQGALSQIAKFFMAEDAAAVPAMGAIRLISTAGARMEMEEVAREAKRLIRSGRKAGEIAVVTRNLRTYADEAREAFASMGVPLDAPRRSPRERSKLFALLWQIVELAEGDFDRETVVKTLSSSYVDLEGLTGARLTGEDIARIARAAGVVKGYRQWQARLASVEMALKAQIERGEDAGETDSGGTAVTKDDLARIAALGTAVTRLKDIATPLEEPAAPGLMTRRFADAVEVLGVRRRILEEGLPEEVFFRDLAAYAAITDAFTAMAGTRRGAVAVSARTFLELAGDVAEAGGTSGELSAGGVALVDVVTARNLSWPVVFLCGVVADAFPSRPPMGPFYSRAERERLAKLGLVTRSEESHLAAERLLFYQAATRAEEALYLTYPSTDEGGKPKLASFYLDEIKSIIAFTPEEMSTYGPSRIVKGVDEAASGAELAMWTGESIGRAKTAEEVAALAAAGAAAYPAFGRALRSAAIEARRESLEGFDYFDGVLTVRAAKAVAGRFPQGRPWSASQLTDYRMCPFRFFLKRVLKADCPEEPDVVPTPLEKGDFAHAFLARFFGDVRDRGMTGALQDGEAAAFKGVFDEAFGAIAAGRERRCGLAGDPFWEMEKGRLRRTLWDFVENEIERLTKAGGRYAPAFFELSFGLETGMKDAASIRLPIEIGEGKRKEKLRGRMDRVDLIDGGEEGQEGIRRVAIVDYKLSRTPSSRDVENLRDMELPVYLLVVPRVVPGEGEALPASAFYRSVSKLSGQRPVVSFDAQEYKVFCAGVTAAVMQCADGVRGGRFQAQPTGECEPYCPGVGVCRCSEARLEFLAEHDE